MFIAVDGNSTGRIIEKLILKNELTKLAQFSEMIQCRIEVMRKTIVHYSGNIIIAGGDNILAEIPSSSYCVLLKEIEPLTLEDYSFSVAVSSSVQGAYLGLKYAKAAKLKTVEVILHGEGEMEFINRSYELVREEIEG